MEEDRRSMITYPKGSKVPEDLQRRQTDWVTAREAECSHVVKHMDFCNFVAEEMLGWRSSQ
jgi:uncharacterized protein YecT (DUF1311 family)